MSLWCLYFVFCLSICSAFSPLRFKARYGMMSALSATSDEEYDSDNMSTRWSIEDDRTLYTYYEKAGGEEALEEVARQLKRGVRGTKARLKKLMDRDSKPYLRLFGRGEEESLPSTGLRPFSEVVTKLLYDPALNSADFYFTYEDRFEGNVRVCANEANDKVKGKERMLIKAIPEHRVASLAYKNRVVWDKLQRLDMFFGGKIEEVIASYDVWEEEQIRAKGKTVFVLYCDLDGVLADFDAGVQRLFGKRPEEVKPKEMWSRLAGQTELGGFFDSLPWMPNGRVLWEAIRQATPEGPTILTGCPHGNWAPPQKRSWCSRELGSHVPVITCMSRDKYRYCLASLNPEGEPLDADVRIVPILIDDRETAAEPWTKAGGVFVHYSQDRVMEALQQLQGLGLNVVIPEEPQPSLLL